MLSKKELFLLTSQQLDKYRLDREKLAASRIKEVTKIRPEVKELTSELKLTSLNLAKVILNGKTNKLSMVDEIRKNNLKIQKKIVTILRELSLPDNYLSPPPQCKICEDYGLLSDNNYCKCRKKIAGKIISDDFVKNSYLSLKSFSSFSLDYYPKEKKENSLIEPREQMATVLEICKNFSSSFNPSSKGIIMYGKTGLGKTHLSLAIANEVLKKGYSVVYITSFELTKNLSDSFFGKNVKQDDFYYLISEADLLIIDDLGAEFDSSFSSSSIYEVINRRLASNKSLIISTNLSLKEIENRYSQRIVSRVFSDLNSLKFIGSDIRQLLTKK